MKCDAVHGKIGALCKKTESVLDMNEIVNLINSAEKSNEVVFMAAS